MVLAFSACDSSIEFFPSIIYFSNKCHRTNRSFGISSCLPSVVIQCKIQNHSNGYNVFVQLAYPVSNYVVTWDCVYPFAQLVHGKMYSVPVKTDWVKGCTESQVKI